MQERGLPSQTNREQSRTDANCPIHLTSEICLDPGTWPVSIHVTLNQVDRALPKFTFLQIAFTLFQMGFPGGASRKEPA